MASQTVVKKPSLWGIIVSPIETLQRIRERPVFWGALLTLLIISIVLFGIIGYYQVNNPELVGMMTDQLTNELKSLSDAERQTAIESLKAFSLVSMIFTGGLSTGLIPLLVAIMLWVILKVLKQKKVTFRQLFSFQVYLYTIWVLGVVVQMLTVVVANGNPEISPTSIAGIIPMNDGFWKAILQGFDVFTFWSLYVLKLGLVEVAQLTSRKAWWITLVFFVCLLGLHLSSYLLFQA